MKPCVFKSYLIITSLANYTRIILICKALFPITTNLIRHCPVCPPPDLPRYDL
mgnify:CR=1 FL=1